MYTWSFLTRGKNYEGEGNQSFKGPLDTVSFLNVEILRKHLEMESGPLKNLYDPKGICFAQRACKTSKMTLKT